MYKCCIFLIILIIQSILSKSFLYSKKNPILMSQKPQISKSKVVKKQPIQQPQSQPQFLLTNAQQQIKSNTQQQPAQLFNGPSLFQSQQVQQAPINFNQPVNVGQNFVPPGMSNQAPIQLLQQQGVTAMNQVSGGTYGTYGRRQQRVPVQQPDVFNDDEPIVQRVKEEKKDAKIEIDIKAQRSMAKLKQEVILPAMVSLKTQGGSRTSVDLICVIDVSGSMGGQKIDLVRSTMKYLLEALTPADRLSIITFENWGERVCGLKCVTPQNMVSLNQHIDGLSARGGTNICSGLDLAVKTIKERKQSNKVTSIFLLSDGQDRGAQLKFKQTLDRQKIEDIFSIHSFGFGTDHDEELMTKICQIKDGSFYFIKELATLDEAFSNALGGVISLVATDVVIKLNNISKNIVEGIKIKRTYGEMWQKISDKEYKIKILQLMSGISKDYVFEIQIPKINTEVGDLDRDHDILEAIFTAKGVDNSKMAGECCFKITLLNQNQEIPEVNQNVDVIENHLRVVAAQAIEQNLKKADQNKLEEAQKGIDTMINNIQTNKKVRQQKMQNLVNDLQNIKAKCASKRQYENEGKKWMKSAQIAHSKQNNYAYSNSIQQQMVFEQKSKKSYK